VLALCNFKAAAQQHEPVKQYAYSRKAVNYLHNAMRKDKDSSYLKLFLQDINVFHDSLKNWAQKYYLSDKQKSQYYAQSLIFLFKDTTDTYRKLFPQKPRKITVNNQNSIIPQNQALNQTDALGRRQGLWVARYPNGKLKYMIYFKDGHPAGIFKRYYPNGQLLVEMKYDQNGKHAFATFYDEDGHKIATGYYYGQLRDSLWRFYINDTIVIKEVMYYRGKKNGFERIYSYYYYPNLLKERYYKNGQLDSVAVDYYYDGTPKAIMFYKNGTLDGPYQVFYYTGQLKIKGQYKNGYMEGLWEFHNPDGSIDTIRYHLGEPVNFNETEAETKILKAMESAKGKYPEPEELFRKQFGLEEW
jgi:antitoxin component YwqK of YwqJK toxin-antitoxin module